MKDTGTALVILACHSDSVVKQLQVFYLELSTVEFSPKAEL